MYFYKSLLRRAAAARCRQKRKHWISNLEKKADELQSTNVRLQVSSLVVFQFIELDIVISCSFVYKVTDIFISAFLRFSGYRYDH